MDADFLAALAHVKASQSASNSSGERSIGTLPQSTQHYQCTENFNHTVGPSTSNMLGSASSATNTVAFPNVLSLHTPITDASNPPGDLAAWQNLIAFSAQLQQLQQGDTARPSAFVPFNSSATAHLSLETMPPIGYGSLPSQSSGSGTESLQRSESFANLSNAHCALPKPLATNDPLHMSNSELHASLAHLSTPNLMQSLQRRQSEMTLTEALWKAFQQQPCSSTASERRIDCDQSVNMQPIVSSALEIKATEASKQSETEKTHAKESAEMETATGESSQQDVKLDELPTQPYYPTHFMRGTAVQLKNGDVRRVENMQGKDFRDFASDAVQKGLGMQIGTVKSMQRSSCGRFTRILFAMKRTQTLCGNNAEGEIESPIEYPFYETYHGWSSCEPQKSMNLYGLSCRKLQLGDKCIILSNQTDAN